jgi:transposase InsO family protein
MPWEVSTRMSERMEFVLRLRDGEPMSDLCRGFGISRKTGYKFKERFERLGPAGLYDLPRTPRHIARRISDAIRERLLETRREHPRWGPHKLKAWLTERYAGVAWPSTTTIGEILSRAGLVPKRRRRRGVVPFGMKLRVAEGPNDLWCADYKGQFRLGNGRYCYPLTVTDQVSRYILSCEGFEAIDGERARLVFEDLFARHGLPLAIRTDNGAPFASRGLLGLSRLSAWWLKLGIVPERIAPGKPEQNGRHERMHRTLKAETTRPAGANLLQQQERFDSFVWTFNHERPHEALGQRPPNTVYRPSTRAVKTTAAPLEYPLHDDVRTVARSGHVHLLSRREPAFFLSTALAGERIGIRELDDGRWLLSFATLDLGWFDPASRVFRPIDLHQPLDKQEHVHGTL